jgi:HAD superfamily hydrolase (TIGR01509 family)
VTAAARPAAVLLDFDGLICDTEHAGLTAWREVYAEHGLRFPAELWRAMVGRADGERLAAEHLTARIGAERGPAAVARRKERKWRLCDGEPLRPGVGALLDAAREGGVPAAVVSSAPHAWVGPHLERLGVHDRFATVVTGDLTPRHKPHPDLYELALRRLGCAPGRALAFEDSAIGVRAARAAGVRCVAVPNGAGDADELRLADAVLPSLAHYDLAADLVRTEGTPVA